MRRIALVAIAALGTVLLPLTSAQADPSPAAIPVPAATPGQTVCTVNKQLSNIVGVAATSSGYALVDKSNTSLTSKVWQITSKCALAGAGPIQYTGGNGSNNPSDIQLSADGSTYWVADSGDNPASPSRPSIALWKIPVNKSKGTLYRFQFPQGDGPYDCDAMLMNGTAPIFVTHPSSGPAGIYTPASAMSASTTVPLKKVGEFTPQKTGTANKLGLTGQQTVTGGAVSPDGKRVVLRTYSDAYEWDVPDGDIGKALTTTTPRITPLPNEDGGEAITYSTDGKHFITVNDTDVNTPATMLSYTPAAAVPAPHSTGGAAGAKAGDGKSWFDKISLNQAVYLVAAVGVVGLIMVAAGMIGISIARKRRPAPEPGGGAGARPGDDGPDDLPVPAGDRAAAPAGLYQRDSDRYGGPEPADRDAPPDAGYLNGRGGRPDRPAQRGRAGTYSSSGGVYGGGRDAGARDAGARDADAGDGGGREGGGVYGGGRQAGSGVYGAGRQRDGRQGGGVYGAGRPGDGRPNDGQQGDGRQGDGRQGDGRQGDGRQSGSYAGGHYTSGGYQPPAPPPPPRGDGGIARSHRPGRSARGSAPPPRKSGYAEEHDGFDDLRRLSE